MIERERERGWERVGVALSARGTRLYYYILVFVSMAMFNGIVVSIAGSHAGDPRSILVNDNFSF